MKFLFTVFLLTGFATAQKTGHQFYTEPYRPKIHFSPKEKWMNDPNGMVFYNGVYHLFFQYYPDSTVWGPMHWGHATSKDLIHWQQQPIALYPDSLGYIFSGSAVIDKNNTSGFGKNGKIPMVAIFTQHDPIGEKKGTSNYQNQSIAYSLDDGKTWFKYNKNPVLKNPGIKDFRDPKVHWYPKDKKWIMALATLDRITFYSSKNLKTWTKESEFGQQNGAHSGVWECPDIFPLKYNGQTIWVLIVSINPGGPNGGSGTQYFTGTFNGKTFTSFDNDIKWIDYGPDDYAGVTWSNTGEHKIFLGWMSNWQYATVVPTKIWRSAMTVPRDLGLKKVNGKYYVTSQPVNELNDLNISDLKLQNFEEHNFDLTSKTGKLSVPVSLKFSSDKIDDFSISLSNPDHEKMVIGYDKTTNHYYIDRTSSGKTDFEKNFSARVVAPKISNSPNMDMILIIDKTSVEMFADKGLTNMTAIFFPNRPYSRIVFNSAHFKIKDLQYHELKSIWNQK